VYDPSEAVSFNALLVGQDGTPINDAGVDLTVRNRLAQNVGEVKLTPTGDGSYSGSLSGLGEGRYSFDARAVAGSVVLGTDSGSVIVQPLNLEFIRTQMNAGLLRQIASFSGGEFLSPSQFISKGIDIQKQWKSPVRHSRSESFELLSSVPILAFVAVLLAVEWLTRKLWGLP